MSVIWTNAAALAGLALVALPIAIHLLVRQQARTLAFPSLRFLHETALAAFRRRRVQDVVLLLCRVAIVAVAATALAGPVLRTPGRTAAYANRVARAIVIVDSESADSLDALAAGAFRSVQIQRTHIADALADAIRWLDRQPPAAREIVLAGAFRRGSIDRSDLIAVPEPVGLRFARQPDRGAPAVVSLPALRRRNDSLVLVERRIRLRPDETEVSEGDGRPLPADRIRVLAPANHQPLAEAALAAALDAGVGWPSPDRRVLIVWDGADEARVQAKGGLDVVRMRVPDPPSTSASAIVDALEAATPRVQVDPVLIPGERLDEWSRPPGAPPADAPPADEGDRRWLWALAALLLVAEQWLRRAREERPDALGQEARVA
jgi:hypothetical protein